LCAIDERAIVRARDHDRRASRARAAANVRGSATESCAPGPIATISTHNLRTTRHDTIELVRHLVWQPQERTCRGR